MRGASLNRILLSVLGGIIGLSVAAASAFVLVTTALHRAKVDARSGVEGVWHAEHAATLVLLHARVSEPVVRVDLEAMLRSSLADAGAYVTSPEEAALLARTLAAVERYLEAARARGPDETSTLQAAYEVAQALAELNLRQAREAVRESERWRGLAVLVAVTAGLALVSSAGLLLWWLRARAIRPVLALGQTIERFAAGEYGVRALEDGPEEIAGMARRFNAMADAIAAEQSAKLAFVAGVAHELRTPVSALKLCAAGFEDAAALPPEPKIRRSFGLVRRQTSRIERMLEEFLDTARIQAGRLDLRPAEVDLRDVVRDSVEPFAVTSPDHALRVVLPPDPVRAWCDPGRLVQVVTNLVANAIKYSPAGGDVTITLRAAHDVASIAVTDDGVGLSPEERARIFAPFQRAGELKGKVPGSGLGLFVVQRIVAAHRGTVRVESAVGRGSTFVVELPRQAALGHGQVAAEA